MSNQVSNQVGSRVGSDRVGSTTSRDDPHATEATVVRYAPAVLTRRASDGSDLEVVALRVLGREVELDQRHAQVVLELLEIFDGTVLLPPALRVEGLEELRVDPI